MEYKSNLGKVIIEKCSAYNEILKMLNKWALFRGEKVKKYEKSYFVSIHPEKIPTIGDLEIIPIHPLYIVHDCNNEDEALNKLLSGDLTNWERKIIESVRET